MTLQQASVLAAPVLRRGANTGGDPSLEAVILWAALGLILSIVLVPLEPATLAAVQILS
jgi:hypothetical protein